MKSKRAPRRDDTRIGLALAGGGPEGAVYEIGALRALEEALEGLNLNDLGVYVGVSAGSFIAACLANGIGAAQMCRAIVSAEPGDHPFATETFFTPGVGEMVRRGARFPRLLVEALWRHLRHRKDLTLLDSLTRLARALPVGLFDNEPIRAYLERIFSIPGRSDDFRRLRSRLVVVAADLWSGRAVRFGERGLEAVPISRAVQASTALPGLYPPVRIGDRDYVDGVLLKTVHASVALDHGARLVLCVNPIVPVEANGLAVGEGVHGPLRERGLPTLLSQTFRTLIHSRLTVGLARYGTQYRGADVLLFEPRPDDVDMFFTNIFSFSSRRRVAEHAYRATRRDLLRRRAEIGPLLARHGIRLRTEILCDEARDLWAGVGLAGARASDVPVSARLDRALTQLEQLLDGECA